MPTLGPKRHAHFCVGISFPVDNTPVYPLEIQRFYAEFRDGKRECYQREKRYLHKNGHVVWAQASASAIRSNSGELIYIISMVEDITERKKLEQEVLETSANERRRVGHELHDGLGQYLAGI